MYLHIKFDGHEIVVTRPGTNMMTAYRKAPDRPRPDSDAKLGNARRQVIRDQRVSCPRLSSCHQESANRGEVRETLPASPFFFTHGIACNVAARVAEASTSVGLIS